MTSYTGLKIGFAPLITFQSAENLSVVKNIPLKRMLLETDSPYFNAIKTEPFSHPNQVALVLSKVRDIREKESLHQVM